MSIYEKAQLIIMVQGPSTSGIIGEAERIKKLYPHRVSVSRPIPHVTRRGWWVLYLDVYPQIDSGLIVEGK